jgi:hypothetical protein
MTGVRPDDRLDQPVDEGRMLQLLVHDRRLGRAEPLLGGPPAAEDDLGVGILRHQLAPVIARRPVDGRVIAGKDLAPGQHLAAADRVPLGNARLAHVAALHDFEHRVAGIEAQPLQRQLERHGAGPPETGADDLDRHVDPFRGAQS